MKVRATGKMCLLAAFAVAWSCVPGAAHAATAGADAEISDVAIMVTRPDDKVLTQAAVRVQRDLRQLGFESHFATCQTPDAWEDTPCGAPPPLIDQGWGQPPPASDAGGVIGTRREQVGSLLAIFLGRENEVVTIEVIAKLTDGWKPFRQVFVPPNGGGNDSSILAARAVELVHDIQLDIQRWQAARQVPVTDQITEQPAAPPAVSPFYNWRLTAAASVLQGRRGLGASVAPALGIAADWGAHFSLLATFAGPFYKDLSASTLGTANTRQEFGLLGLRYAFGERRVRPFIGVATGVYHLRATGGGVEGESSPAAVALWAPLVSAGGGASVSIAPWLALIAQTDVLMTTPAGDVTVGSTVVGRAGGPSFLIQTGACFSL